MLRKIFALMILSVSLLQASAQINPNRSGNPPVLRCVKNQPANTIQIQWDAPLDAGPCFTQYAIYLARGDRNGPYEKIDSIASPGSGFLNINPSFAGNVFVFMTNEQSCNNAPPSRTTSDTLDNIVPQPPVSVINLTVENDRAVINWQASPSPEVAAYVIYSNVNNFNTPIDTVLGRFNNTYADPTSTPGSEIAVYRIRTLEFCEADTGLLGNITPSFNTIRVQAGTEEPCARAIDLTWNGYNNQSAGVLGYIIESSTDAGATFTSRDTLPESARTFNFSGLPVGTVTCIRVRALLPGGISSSSNLLCVVGQGVAPVEVHYIQNITVGPESVRIEYIPDPNGAIGQLVLERSSNGQSFNVLTSGVSIQQPVPGGPFIIQDFSALTNRSPYWYRVSIRNQCNDTYSTLPAKTVFLQGQNRGLDNELLWTNFLVDFAELGAFELIRTEGTDTSIVYSGTAETFRDRDVYAGNVFKNSCYFVRYRYEFEDPDRPAGEQFGVSNAVCLEPRPQGFVPNAFAPQGTNKVFRPILTFSKEDNYLFEVFNRFGEKVFSSNRPGQGWDGIYKGSLAPVDSYIYHLTFTGLDDVEYTRSGFVLLVR